MGSLLVNVVVIECLLRNVLCDGVGCLDNSGNPVDWFIVYKLPRLHNSEIELVRDGVGQAYMDVNSGKWMMLDKGINNSGHAVYNTLQQIYQNANSEKVAYLLYNDQPPEGTVTFTHGHTKGDIAFDQSSGFWLVHSVPKFSPPAADGYKYPLSGMVFGQTLLCVTFNYKQFNLIGKQLLYNYPKIFDHNLPSAFAQDNPSIAAAVNGTHIKSEPWNNAVNLTSSGGRQFISFAKFTDFGKDLYHDWVAPFFRSALLTETWQNGRGKMNSDCTNYKVLNVQNLRIISEIFAETEDHSKWAVTDSGTNRASSKWICIGDINRMEEQMKRAGGTVCTNLGDVWNSFRKAITSTEQCNNFFGDPTSVHAVRL